MKKFTTILIAVLLLVSMAGCAASNQDAGNTKTTQLTLAECQGIALDHANLKENEVTNLHGAYEVDDGIPQYEIEFRQGDYQYDYTIHAETGKVLEWDKEYDPITKPTAPDNPTTAPEAPTTPTEPKPEKLTKEQAQSIALEQANATAEEVTNLRSTYEVDDGIPQYEIEFRQGDYEYDYTIHAETGKVLEWDKEYDPITKPTTPDNPTTAPEPPTTPTEPKPEKLTREQVKAIALDHAGLTAEQVRGLEIEYDVDDGVPEYSVEFNCDGWEYDYEIHAETGKILEWDKDRD